MLDKLNIFSTRISNILTVIGAIGLLIMTVIISWKVFGRYVLNSTPNWAEQSALVLMIWYVSFAAAAGVKEGFHIRIVALENACSEKLKFYLRCFVHLVVMTAGLSLCIWSIDLVAYTWSHDVPTLGIPRGAVYLSLPISGALMGLFAFEHLCKLFAARELNEGETH